MSDFADGAVMSADRLYTSYADAAIIEGAVLVRAGRVVAAGPAETVLAQAPPTTARIALGAVTLGPGFVDAHVHLGFDGGDDPVAHLIGTDDESLAREMTTAAEALARAGVTTARELGARALLDRRVAAGIADGTIAGPRLVTAGRPLTSRDGHCWFFGGECVDRAALLTLVRAQRDAGCEWVKLVVSGGFLTDGTVPQDPQFAEADMRAVVEEAHAHGMRVAAHSHSTASIVQAALAGVDTIEHCTFMAGSGIDFDPRVVALLAERGVAVCPTVNRATTDYPPEFGELSARRLVQMRAQGVRMIMGTDAGVRRVPHDAYADGLSALSRAGLSNRDVLDVATAGSADGLGLDGGRLTPGQPADLVALGADPIEDLGAARDVQWVMARGRILVGAHDETIAAGVA